MQCSVPVVQQSLCLQWWDNRLQQWVYNGCTVRFVYRIFKYSIVLGIFDSLGFRMFVLALLKTGVYSMTSKKCWDEKAQVQGWPRNDSTQVACITNLLYAHL